MEDADAPAIADEDGDGEHAEWNKVALLLLREDIGKPLQDCEDHLTEMPGILDVFGLEKSPDHTLFCNWEKGISMRTLRSLLRKTAEQAGFSALELSMPIASNVGRRVITGVRKRLRQPFLYHRVRWELHRCPTGFSER